MWLWAGPGPFIVRAAFDGVPPGYQPIWQLQFNSEILAGLAGLLALAVAVGYQRRVPFDFDDADWVFVLDPDLWTTTVGRVIRILVALALLMGFMTSPLDLGILAIAFLFAGFALPWLARRIPAMPPERRLSLPIAGAVGIVLAFVIAAIVTSLWFQPAPTEFFPFVLSIALSAVAISLAVELLGPARDSTLPATRAGRGVSPAVLALVASGSAVAYFLLAAEPALAEDCVDLSDCSAAYISAKVWAIIVAAGVVAWTFVTVSSTRPHARSMCCSSC